MNTRFVSWYEHDCDWITKYCDEHHQRYATIPVDVLEQYATDGGDY